MEFARCLQNKIDKVFGLTKVSLQVKGAQLRNVELKI